MNKGCDIWAAIIILSFKSKTQHPQQKNKAKSKTTYKSKRVSKSRPKSKPIMIEFKHNDKVKVLYCVNEKRNRWFAGVIESITKRKYYIKFDDGSYEPISKTDSITRIKRIKSI
jgi:hypothetical protein